MALAKTSRPRLHGIVPRPRLFRILDAYRAAPITWVSGPPGSGKTSLVATYLRARKLPGLWYQVDETDADAATLFHYIRESVRGGKQELPALTPEYLTVLTTFTPPFFRKLFSKQRTPFVLTLDNFQEVPESSTFPGVIREAVLQLPPGGRVIIISRTEPPPAFARLRANRAIQQMTWPDLRLTLCEAEQVARAAAIGAVPSEALKALYETADGWAAGIVLLLEQLKTRRLRPGEHLGMSPVIFDYMAGEVFRRMTPAAQDVMLKVSLLPQVTARIAEQLTGRSEAEAVLAELHRHNYFTNAIGTADRAYRFHPLFQEFLRAQARRVLPEGLRAEIQRNAAALLEESGQIDDAVAMLVGAEDWERLAGVLRSTAPSLLAEGRGQTLLERIARLPETLREQDRWLLYWHGAATLPRSPGCSRTDFERALGRFREQGDGAGAFLAWSAIAETFIHESRDLHPLDRWIALLGELREEFGGFPSPDVEARVASCMFPALYWRQPQHAEMEGWTGRVEALFRTHPEINLRLQLGLHLVGHFCWKGAFGRAAVIVRPLGELSDSDRASPLVRLIAKVALAMYQWLTASLDECLRTVSDALEMAKSTGVHVWDHHLSLHRVAAELCRGDVRAAGDILERVGGELQTARPFDLLYFDALTAWRALLTGDLATAAAANRRSLYAALQIGIPSIEAQARLVAIWVQLRGHGRDLEEVRRELAVVYQLARDTRSGLVEFSALLAEAYGDLTSGQEQEGLRCLEGAMRLGRENQYWNTYTWLAPVMADLCVRALEAGIERKYVMALIRKRNLMPDQPPVEVEDWPWPIKVYTLGRFEVLRDGVPVQFSGKVQKRPLALLRALIALGGEQVHEDRLADVLWPEADGDAAQQALAVTLHRLRRLLGDEDAVRRQAGRLSLDQRRCWTDVTALDRILSHAEHLGTNGTSHQWVEAAHWTDRAVGLYAGDFLADDQDSPWAAPFAERLRERVLRQVQRIARNWEQGGDWIRAAECYKRALDLYPCSEECCRSLMLTYERLGRRDEALAAYQRCARHLAEQLGIHPSPQTLAIIETLKSGA